MELTRAHNSLPDIAHRAAILCLHGVIAHSRDPEVESEAMEIHHFRRLLKLLRRSFNVIGLAELVAAIRERRSPPPRSVVITFDDGYVTHHSVVAGEMAAMRMPWSAFVPAMLIETGGRQWTDDLYLLIHRGSQRQIGFCWDNLMVRFDLHTPQQRQDAVFRIREACRYLPEPVRVRRLQELYDQYSLDELQTLRARYADFGPMTWAQVKDLIAAGVDVGSHGLSHIALAPQDPDLVLHEVAGARELLMQRVGAHSPHFSYPYGREASMSPVTEQLLLEMGYHCALTLEQNAVYCQNQNLMRLPRLIVGPSVGRILFVLWQRFIR
ncbi:MAG TPA: polysaccharide deacetylase family protein [Phycisphaerae bacterium]|nr:polysaccharide deacetylase family protein [Phycisphaerae bacterium]HRY70823.1 polysaccharide deacetylase family protein [Phycisphaerae bacterium]HSA28328.1 polysaccharide deacetylase family protein [Phycisphaerae bacterium]